MQPIEKKTVSLKEAFQEKEILRKCIYNNRDMIGKLINSKLSNELGSYIAGDEEIRPDLFFTDSESLDKIAVLINYDEPIEEHFKKLLAAACFKDVQKAVWILAHLDKKTRHILNWLNDKAEGRVEFIAIRIIAYELENSMYAFHLCRPKKPEIINNQNLS
ncbi:MAG: hypothetical protein WCG23_07455 [bacterium]